ncbi:MAG TPA: hypothetical protein VFL41_03690 [Gaiellaceae bacterium]|nr:hypothetical protein [Gaiellaceae bacterium]
MPTLFRHPARPLLVAALLALALAPGASPQTNAPLAAPVITFACTPAPEDCTGWYTTNVTVRWTWDATAIITVGCNTNTITADTQGTVQSCYAENASGQSTRVEIRIKVDKTPPTVTGAVPDRPPDANGWYNHPLSVTFHGADATSGVAGCSVAGYAGPDNAAASVAGTCRDNAGHTSAPLTFGFKYDSSPPTVQASSFALNRAVVVRWTVSPDTQMVSVHRAPIAAKGTHQVNGPRVYRGAAKLYLDRRLHNGVSYIYTVFAVGQAGLVGSAKVEATPTPLFSPPRSALVRRPPLLRWAAVPRATYYNVQLRRNGRKILSAWPVRTNLQLRWTWRFQNLRFRLSPGRYEWYVWPGFGSPAEVQYGRLLGRSGFALTR